MDYSIVGLRVLVRSLAIMLAAQLPGAPQTQPPPTTLSVIVVRGDGATGRIRQRSGQDPAVRILDENDKPVAGAAVVFTLPTEGATGAFGNGSKTLMVLTDHDGMAPAQGLRFNQVPGKVQVHVNVSYKGLTARTNISQVSDAPAGYRPGKGGGSGKMVAILALLAAGGAGGAYYAMHGGSGAASAAGPAAPTAIGLTPGTGTLGPPR